MSEVVTSRAPACSWHANVPLCPKVHGMRSANAQSASIGSLVREAVSEVWIISDRRGRLGSTRPSAPRSGDAAAQAFHEDWSRGVEPYTDEPTPASRAVEPRRPEDYHHRQPLLSPVADNTAAFCKRAGGAAGPLTPITPDHAAVT